MSGRVVQQGDAIAIAGFWRWWTAKGADAAARAIATGSFGRLPDKISRRIDAIHPNLEWELAAGTQARHVLCITAAGLPELRPTAERVFRAAPPATSTWEYRPARVANTNFADARVELGSDSLRCADTRYQITVDDRYQVIDVGVYHPRFAQVGDDVQRSATFLLLDWLLGEDGVERWVGGVTTLVEQPGDGLPADDAIAVVAALADRHATHEWALLHYQRPTGPIVMISARRPLKWIDFPLHDQHIAVSLHYERNEVGLPTQGALDQLRAAEDELVPILAESATILAAHETSDGLRTLHFYADSADQRAAIAIRVWAGAQPRHTAIEITDDPGWRSVQGFR
jgi:hypothetical protein